MSQNPHDPTSKSGTSGNYASSGTSSPGGESSGTFRQVSQQVKKTTSEVMNQAKERAVSAVESQKSTAADRLGHIAQAIRSAGSNLDDDPAVSRLADRAAQTVERFSDSIRQHEWSDIVGSAEDFARRNPALFIGGAFAAGLLIARFLKSSRHQRFEQHPYQSQMSGSRFGRDDSQYYDEGDSGDEFTGESLYGSQAQYSQSQYSGDESGASRGRSESSGQQSYGSQSKSPGSGRRSDSSGSEGEAGREST